MRDHGGDLDQARARHGAGDWLDLSTGINARPYPVPELPARAFAALPEAGEIAALEAAAARAYETALTPVALAGAQAAIQLVPRLGPDGPARVLGPTYNEHAAALAAQGRAVTEVTTLEALQGAAVAVVVNPNNPDGQRHAPEDLEALAEQVGLLVVDESFCDPEPALSLAPRFEASASGAARENLLILRSFGKFYGLAGLRLGFTLSGPELARTIRAAAGPWAVSGPAIATGRAALEDRAWQQATTTRLGRDAARLDGLAARVGWALVGGTPLFRTYETGDAQKARDHLARAHIWSRAFPYSTGWLRLGLPGDRAGWQRLEAALVGAEDKS
ncbi:threonine-phosphate decarboxylase CobD [Roseivivax sp.]